MTVSCPFFMLRWALAAIAAVLLPVVIALTVASTPAWAALEPGTSAIVRADGDCLRLRAQPGLQNTVVLTCIPDGSVVSVLAGSVASDGFQWQRVTFGSQTGWAVDQYLQPFSIPPGGSPPPVTQPTAAPIPTAIPTALPTPGFSGTVPASGIGLAVWSGGPIDRMPPVALGRGCALRAVWIAVGGEFVGYVFGAPAIVNTQWAGQYPDGSLPVQTPVILVCATGAPPPASTPSGPPPTGPVATPGVPPGMPPGPPGPAGNR